MQGENNSWRLPIPRDAYATTFFDSQPSNFDFTAEHEKEC